MSVCVILKVTAGFSVGHREKQESWIPMSLHSIGLQLSGRVYGCHFSWNCYKCYAREAYVSIFASVCPPFCLAPTERQREDVWSGRRVNEERENRRQRKERVNRVKIVRREGWRRLLPVCTERTVYEAWKVIEGRNPHAILKTQSCSARRRDALATSTHMNTGFSWRESRTDRRWYSFSSSSASYYPLFSPSRCEPPLGIHATRKHRHTHTYMYTVRREEK